ncbi:MAG: ATP-binding protein [Anaerolineae bacterium]
MAKSTTHSLTRLLGDIWSWLTRPAASVKEPEHQRQARLLASLLIAFVLLVILLSVASELLNPAVPPSNNPGLYLAAGLAVLFTIAYGLNRAGYYILAAVLGMGVLSGSVFGGTLAIFAGANPNWDPTDTQPLIFLVVPVLLASMLLPLPVTIVLIAINAAGMLTLPMFFPDVTFAAIATGPLLSILAVSLLILLTAYHRNLLEMDRQAEMSKKVEELTALSQASQAVTASLELDQVLAEVVSLASEAVNSDYTSVALVDEAGSIGRSVENLPGVPAIGYRIRDEGLTNWIVHAGQVAIIDEIGEDGAISPDLGQGAPHFANPLVVEAGIKSVAGLPMMVKGNLLGVLYLHSLQPAAFHGQLSLLTTFAAQAAIAIENSRLFQAEREQRELSRALREAAAAVNSTLHLDQVLDRILEQVERVVLGDAFNVMLIENGKAALVRGRGYEHLDIEDRIPRPSVAIAEYPNLVKMMRTGEPLVVPDTSTDPNWVWSQGREWRRSYVAAPIRVGGATVGFLNVIGTRPGQFGPADAQRLQAFSDHVGTAIQNARLYRKQLNYANGLEERVRDRTAQLQAQYARLAAILSSASDGIVVTDLEGGILQANPVADAWLIRTLPPKDATRLRGVVRDLAQRAEEGPKAVLELTGLDLELSAAPVSEPGAEEAAAVVVIHDVSHLKALDRMKTRFVSNVSHELRTPVTTIKLYTELMQRHPEKWEEYAATLAQEADRQARLVENILQISTVDAGRLEMKPRPTSLDELAEIAIVNHQTLARERGLTLEHQPAEPGPVALVDPEWMMQALNNLVENAIHYTPEGGKVVIFTDNEEAEGRAWATIAVEDTGMGIPEEELPHIFERFFRGEGVRLIQLPGTGLGLAIVKEIVELHGGRVTLESQVGEGTTFTIWLPLAD